MELSKLAARIVTNNRRLKNGRRLWVRGYTLVLFGSPISDPKQDLTNKTSQGSLSLVMAQRAVQGLGRAAKFLGLGFQGLD